MSYNKQKPETFNTRVFNTVNTPCWLLQVTNYGEKKSSFNFYTKSESYAEFKKKGLLQRSPEAVIKVTTGVIKFVENKEGV